MMKKIFKPKFILFSIILPSLVLLFYDLVMVMVLDSFQIKGVNYIFVFRFFWVLVSFIMVVGIFFSILLIKQRKSLHDLFDRYSIQKFEFPDSILFFLPLTPIVQYILSNFESISILDAMIIFTVFLFMTVILVGIIPLFLGKEDAKTVTMFLALAFMFTLNAMSILADEFSWFAKGSLKIQLLVFGLVFLLCYFLYMKMDKRFLYGLLIMLFLVNSSTTFYLNYRSKKTLNDTMKQSELLNYLYGKTPIHTPNVYLLVYDAYAQAETLESYGITNIAQEEYLKKIGFKIYSNTYSVGADSINSMSRVLNISTNLSGNYRQAVSGNGVVQKLFKENGYLTYGLFPYDLFFQGIGSSYDISIPQEITLSYNRIIPAIMIGEFRFDFHFGQISREKYLEYKKDTFTNLEGRRFIYMHTDLPSHSQNSGKCLHNEIDLYKDRLDQANIEMKNDLSILINKDPNAIIIVAGDHGPYLTKNCMELQNDYSISEISRLDIQDQYGTFLAIRWPEEDYFKYDKITVLQDIFPAILAYMYGDEVILKNKINPESLENYIISGAEIMDNIIHGGINDGEPLFLSP